MKSVKISKINNFFKTFPEDFTIMFKILSKTSLNGIWFFLISVFQLSISKIRNSCLNGPEYERNPQQSKTSPTSLVIS